MDYKDKLDRKLHWSLSLFLEMASYKGHLSHVKPVPAPRQASSPMSPTMYAEANRPLPSQIMAAAAAGMSVTHQPGTPMSDAKAKTVLKEAVDAVVNSFAKHSHGYGRGKDECIG